MRPRAAFGVPALVTGAVADPVAVVLEGLPAPFKDGLAPATEDWVAG